MPSTSLPSTPWPSDHDRTSRHHERTLVQVPGGVQGYGTPPEHRHRSRPPDAARPRCRGGGASGGAGLGALRSLSSTTAGGFRGAGRPLSGCRRHRQLRASWVWHAGRENRVASVPRCRDLRPAVDRPVRRPLPVSRLRWTADGPGARAALGRHGTAHASRRGCRARHGLDRVDGAGCHPGLPVCRLRRSELGSDDHVDRRGLPPRRCAGRRS